MPPVTQRAAPVGAGGGALVFLIAAVVLVTALAGYTVVLVPCLVLGGVALWVELRRHQTRAVTAKSARQGRAEQRLLQEHRRLVERRGLQEHRRRIAELARPAEGPRRGSRDHGEGW